MFLNGRRLLKTAVELFSAQKMGRVKWQRDHWRCGERQVCGSTIVYVGSNYVWFVYKYAAFALGSEHQEGVS